MKTFFYSTAFLMLLIIVSCGKKQPAPAVQSQLSVDLTELEKTGGKVTPEILWKFSRLGSVALSPDGSVVLYTVTKTDLPSETRITNIYSILVTGGEAKQITSEGGASPQWIEGGKKVIFVKKGSLWTMNPDGTNQKEISGPADFEYFSVSPAGDKMYFTRRIKLDQTANEKHNLPKAKVRIIDDLMYRHWNTWCDYSYSHIFVAAFDGSSVTGEKDIMEGQKFESPLSPNYEEGEISWSPDGKSIAFTTKRLSGVKDAVSTNSDIYLYDITNGTETNISEGNSGYDRFPVFSPDGSKIAFQSMERDGYESDLDRIFVYDISNKTKSNINKDWDFDCENINWENNETILFTSSYLGTTHVFRTILGSGKVEKLTEGIHELTNLNHKSGVLVAALSTFAMAPEVVALDTKSGEIKQVTSVNSYIYDHIKMGRFEVKYVKTKDGKDLHNWVIYPPDFDPSKKYPLLLFCKGGPQGPPAVWSYRWNFQIMAANGYIVIAPSRRGTTGFGQEWKEQISGDYGGKNIQDYLDATDAMAKEPYIDASHMGAVGASYGGYSVFYLAGVHQGRFKAFISHAGVFNFESEYGSTEELWFPNFDYGGPYWEKPQSYKYSPHLLVKNWDTPIMIVTGQNDYRIPYTQSLEAFTAARMLGIPSKLLFFEDEYHFVVKPQNAVIWQREFFEWLDKYLK